ncbi:MAG: hypothetical protein ACKVQB_03060 [Bacteroidia bacterium]
MKQLISIALFLVCYPIYAVTPSANEVRQLYQKAVTEEVSCNKIISILRNYNENNNPLLAGYKACAIMMMANHVINPYTKLSNFKKGKNLLEKCIVADSKNIELRFLRFSIQTKAPSFLGYTSAINKDKLFLINSVSSTTDSKLKELIVLFLKNSENLSEAEKLKLD